ncbi:MAG: molybdopterin-dependent oxidoreductase [Bryobacterales bacterium]|nr:molybdopterin-dependent oxidoreductase [Bryobacterales bacterium]
MGLGPFAEEGIVSRRAALGALGAMGAVLTGCARKDEELAEPEVLRRVVSFPDKDPLYLLTDRPPQLETPIRYFKEDLTPNRAFYVRWHLANLPKAVDLNEFRLRVGGHVANPMAFSVDDLRKKFEPVSYVALNQCSGNSRSFFEPHIPGGQWGHGAMGNARWTGVRLRDLLDAAKLKTGALDVTVQGLDTATMPGTPAYVKSLDVERARDGEVMVAYEMNGEPLPMLNGFPLRLVVPGWYATYWMKALSEIQVLPARFDGFWMKKAYLIPNDARGEESPDALAANRVPISKMAVHSIFVSPALGEELKRGASVPLEGLANDGGAGIRQVEVSTDGGQQWVQAKLDPSLGRYSWRRWKLDWTPATAGIHRLMVRATNEDGETQVEKYWNRSGYMRQVIESLDVKVV